MNRSFCRNVVYSVAAGFAGFAVWLGVDPNALLEAFEIEGRSTAMTTEIRAFYGGVEMAIAVAMVVLWRRGNGFAALLIGGLPLLGSAVGRGIGLVVDGWTSMHAGFALFELAGAAACLAAARWVAARQIDSSIDLTHDVPW